jgi:hypothetical protein
MNHHPENRRILVSAASQLPPLELYAQFFKQYLFALFYEIFYLSFMAENRERLRHREGALGILQQNVSGQTQLRRPAPRGVKDENRFERLSRAGRG